MSQQSSYVVNTLLTTLIESVRKQSQLNQTKKYAERSNILKYGKQIAPKFVDQLIYQKNGYPVSQKYKTNNSNIRTFRRSCNNAEVCNLRQGEFQFVKPNYLNINIRPDKISFNSVKKINSHKKIQMSVNTSPEKQLKSNHCRAFTQDLIKLDQVKPVIDQDCQQKRILFLKRKALQKQVQNSFSVFQQNRFIKPSFKNLYHKTQRTQQYIYKQGLNFQVVIASSKNNDKFKNFKTLEQKFNIDDSHHKQNKNFYNLCQHRIQLIRNKKKHIKALVKDQQVQQNSNSIDKNTNRTSQDVQQNLHNPNIQIVKNVSFQQINSDRIQRLQVSSKRKLKKKSTLISSPFIDVQNIIKNLKFSKGVFADRMHTRDQDQIKNQQFPFLHKNCQKNRRNTKRLTQRMSSICRNSTRNNSIHRNNQ